MTFQEAKTNLKNLLNKVDDLGFKSEILHNLAVVLYTEINIHNKYIKEDVEYTKNIKQYKNNPLIMEERR
jgi:hypothetical protein